MLLNDFDKHNNHIFHLMVMRAGAGIADDDFNSYGRGCIDRIDILYCSKKFC